jgi:hypothetical protein
VAGGWLFTAFFISSPYKFVVDEGLLRVRWVWGRDVIVPLSSVVLLRKGASVMQFLLGCDVLLLPEGRRVFVWTEYVWGGAEFRALLRNEGAQGA